MKVLFDIVNFLLDFRFILIILLSIIIGVVIDLKFKKRLEAYFIATYLAMINTILFEYLNYLWHKPQAPSFPWLPPFKPTPLMALMQKDYVIFWLVIGLVCVGPTWYILIRILKTIEKLLKGV